MSCARVLKSENQTGSICVELQHDPLLLDEKVNKIKENHCHDTLLLSVRYFHEFSQEGVEKKLGREGKGRKGGGRGRSLE